MKAKQEIMPKSAQIFLAGCVAVLVLAVISSQATAFTPLVVVVGFAAGGPAAPHTQRSVPRHAAVVNMAQTITALSAASDKNEEDVPTSSDVSKRKDKSIFDQINAALDTPILDANERSDQGAIAEALKGFVRSEPQLASISFSAVVVVLLFILVRFFNFLSYGI